MLNPDKRTCSGMFFSLIFSYSILFIIFLDIDECAENILQCPENTYCMNEPGSYKCVNDTVENCPSGYEFNIYNEICEGEFLNWG